MDGITVGAWTVGALAGLGLSIYIRRSSKNAPDPEEKLKELLGPKGMAQRDRSRAERDAKADAERREL